MGIFDAISSSEELPEVDTGGIMLKTTVPEMYKIVLEGGDGFRIETNLPQNFSMTLASLWEDPYNKPADSAPAGGNSVGDGGPTTGDGGSSTKLADLGKLVWQAGSHMEWNIPFMFRATENTEEEVVIIMRDLLKLVAPGMDGDRLVPPGSEEGELTLRIGRFLEIKPVIVDSVGEEFDTMFDADGNPIAVTINVSIKTLTTVTDEMIDEMFITL